MWPFTKSRSQRIEECDHDWEEYVDEISHPRNIYFEDGTPMIHKLEIKGKSCKNCPASEHINSSEKKIYFEVARVEEIE